MKKSESKTKDKYNINIMVPDFWVLVKYQALSLN